MNDARRQPFESASGIGPRSPPASASQSTSPTPCARAAAGWPQLKLTIIILQLRPSIAPQSPALGAAAILAIKNARYMYIALRTPQVSLNKSRDKCRYPTVSPPNASFLSLIGPCSRPGLFVPLVVDSSMTLPRADTAARADHQGDAGTFYKDAPASTAGVVFDEMGTHFVARGYMSDGDGPGPGDAEAAEQSVSLQQLIEKLEYHIAQARQYMFASTEPGQPVSEERARVQSATYHSFVASLCRYAGSAAQQERAELTATHLPTAEKRGAPSSSEPDDDQAGSKRRGPPSS